jgi:ribosomal 50S subunit-recycling heat shock protein
VIASESTSGSGMPAWCERAAPLPRSPAQVTCASNGARIGAPSRFVRIGDVITVALDRTVRVLKVKGFIERRGPAKACDGLYEEMV